MVDRRRALEWPLAYWLPQPSSVAEDRVYREIYLLQVWNALCFISGQRELCQAFPIGRMSLNSGMLRAGLILSWQLPALI